MTAPQAFQLTGPLPTGTTVLEASAGTGKTYTIAGLVTRWVAEGLPLEQLLVVTFGRAATGELRTRVRERFLHARVQLSCPQDARTCDDPVVRLLADAPDDVVRARHDRLADALSRFDTATVATTHEFCRRVLHGLGTAADLDPGTELRESLDELVVEACDDLYLRWHSWSGATEPLFDRRTALAMARGAVRDGEALLVPEHAEAGSSVDVRVRFARAVRDDVERRTRALRVLGFDSLLVRVRDALLDPVTGPAAKRRLREQYAVVLVDEFQDTDPVQWEVLHEAFHGASTLVVIGDPKQAIYAFRGADVHAYLAARAAAGTEATLDTNWRSDPAVLDGLATLFRGAALGHRDIVVRDVRPGHPTPALTPADATPVQLRVVQREGLRQWNGVATVGPARDAVAADVAREVVRLLASDATVAPRGCEAQPVEAADVAVLVRTGAQARLVQDALAAAGVPAVLTGTSSVFATSAAQDWVVLLEALEQPHRTGRVRRLSLTPFVGSSAADVDRGGERATDVLAQQLRTWADVLGERGVAALAGAVERDQRLPERLLRRPDGERLLTDLRHVAEALHREASGGQLGLAGLLSWLRERVEDSTGDLDQERSRRLDTDAKAVQVLTVHTSKGLQFPVVLVPFGWDSVGGGSDVIELPRGHDAAGRRTLHVGGPDAPDLGEACAREEAEEAGEELRLLYVAATRAVSRLVLWWAATAKTEKGPLHRLLLCPPDSADPSAVPVTVPVPDDDTAVERFRGLAAAGQGLRVDVVDRDAEVGRVAPAPAVADVLDAGHFDRELDTAWRRTSYTGLTRSVHDQQAVGSEAQAAVKDDELEDDGSAAGPPADSPLHAVASPMADLPSGAWFGTLVHEVLETADLSGDARAGLLAAAQEQLQHRALDLAPAELADGLLPAVSTPLGPLADGLRFRDIAAADRLPELSFELPLAGGDDPRGEVLLGEVADLLDAHLSPQDRVRPYAALLRAPELAQQSLRGYLTGSLDVVLRVAGPSHETRYVVVDHKTNRLADRDVALTAWHYRPEALDAAVLRAHYPLQALLYCVALHRFLRWRQPGYDPAVHLGGVLYLFLRGMCGEDVGAAAGVWDWQPPAELVVAVSDLLAGGAR